MFRSTTSRTLLRHATTTTTASVRTSSLPLLLLRNQPRLLSTSSSSAAKRSTFKGTVARWALTGAIIYWYSTSSVFADEPKFQEDLPPVPSETETDRPPSLLPTKPLRPPRSTDTSPTSPPDSDTTDTDTDTATSPDGATDGAEALEAEAGQEGAFNPETGEINWDCPCLGGMAHGPCGDEFKAAFSCFVFSTEEPKGVDCIEKFKGMQTCFQKYPEVYGSELDGDEDEDEDDAESAESAIPPAATPDDTPPPLSAPNGTAPATKSSPSGSDHSPILSAAATTSDQAPAHRGTAPAASADTGSASRGGEPSPDAEATAAPTLAEPSRAVAETAVLQQAHSGDAKARSINDPPTERELEVARVDAPQKEKKKKGGN